ncbi:hypothetical protein D9M68_186220 [compost metagenome]
MGRCLRSATLVLRHVRLVAALLVGVRLRGIISLGARLGLCLRVESRRGGDTDIVGAGEVPADKGIVGHFGDVQSERNADADIAAGRFAIAERVDRAGMARLRGEISGQRDRTASTRADMCIRVIIHVGDCNCATDSSVAGCARLCRGGDRIVRGGKCLKVAGVAADRFAVFDPGEGRVERNTKRYRRADASAS